MGTGFHGGFGNTKHVKKNETEDLIKELENNGVKFSKEDIVFITKDKTGQIVWLEKGNSSAGLEHILNGNGKTQGHADDFAKAFGVSKGEIPEYLNRVISHGEVISSILIEKGNREGFERIYYYEGKHYVVTGIGSNGFIVSAYPKKIKGDI